MPMTPDELRAVPDPVERIALTKTAMDENRAEMAVVIREAARELYRTLGGYGAVAKALGVSRARAQQLIKPSSSQM